jgi:8-oxo-dGTP pyrophosphatase MutT (NUDIX family)
MSKDHKHDAKQDLKEAAVLAIQDPGDPKKFLHGRRPDCGKWALPGGHLHPGESREHAAIREVHEETGISLDPKDLVYLGSSEYKPQLEDYEKVLVHLFGLREPWQGRFPNVKETDGEFDRIKFLNPENHDDLYNPNGESILIDHMNHKLVPEEHLTIDEGETPPAKVGRRFYLLRIKDISGVSGTGIVGVGIEFPDGKCVLQWQTDTSTVNNYESMNDLIAVHGHGGHSKVIYVDELEKSDYVKRHHRIFIATDGDNIGASVERAALSNDMRKIKNMDKTIGRGQKVILDWCKKYGGIVFINGGDDVAMFFDKRKFNGE